MSIILCIKAVTFTSINTIKNNYIILLQVPKCQNITLCGPTLPVINKFQSNDPFYEIETVLAPRPRSENK